MIAIDTSALLAVILSEPEAEAFMDILLLQDCVIGAPTLLEAYLALARFQSERHYRALDFLVGRPNVEKAAFDEGHLMLAKRAFDLYGKGNEHKAALNFGDCMTYAVARTLSAPLLFKGDDFTYTDIEPAYRP